MVIDNAKHAVSPFDAVFLTVSRLRDGIEGAATLATLGGAESTAASDPIVDQAVISLVEAVETKKGFVWNIFTCPDHSTTLWAVFTLPTADKYDLNAYSDEKGGFEINDEMKMMDKRMLR